MSFPYKIIDLTHSLTADTPGWELGCGFKMQNILDYSDCDTEVQFKTQHLSMPFGIGTHMDAPAHCKPDGETIDQLQIESHHLLAQAFVIDVSRTAHEHYLISKDDILSFEKQNGKVTPNSVVLFSTGWEKYWHQPEKYRNNLQFPSVGSEAASLLLDRGVAALGIDTLSPDTPYSGFPVHELFLSNGKYLLENISNANKLPPIGSWILSLPLKINQATEAPARIIGMIPV